MKSVIRYFEKGILRIEDDDCCGIHHPSYWCGVYRFVSNGVKWGVYSTCVTPSVYRDLIEHFVETQQFQRLKRFRLSFHIVNIITEGKDWYEKHLLPRSQR